jgi:hypothetical protein
MLTISIAPGAEKVDHLEIKRDGVLVGSGSWATPVPVDPGHHHVEAAAPGYKPFSATVSLATDAAKEVVVVPVLERAPDLPEPVATDVRTNPGSGLRYAGIAVAGAGAVGVVLGSIFGIRAMTLTKDSNADCNAQNVCGTAGFASRNDARSAGDVSTVAVVAGGALLASGGVLFWIGGARSTKTTAMRAAPVVSERGFQMRLEGAF